MNKVFNAYQLLNLKLSKFVLDSFNQHFDKNLRRLIFHTDTAPMILPESLRKELMDISVQTEDGLELSGLYKASQSGKPTFVFFHGNGSNHSINAHNAQYYIEQGYGFLSAGYRGYNNDPGQPSEQGLYKDARAWLDLLTEQYSIPQSNIILHGRSLGTGVATQMALDFPQVKALVLESPYTCLPDVAAGLPIIAPFHTYMKDEFNNLAKIEKISAPLFIIQGSKDDIVPPSQGMQVFDKATSNKARIEFPDAGHADIPRQAATKAVIDFIHTL